MHITRSSRRTNNLEVKAAEKRTREFLSAGSELEDGIDTCSQCRTATFCKAVSAHLTNELTPEQIAAHASLLEAHGIETSSNESICPGKIARVAIRQVEAGNFWIADDDPLNESHTELQIGEALQIATQSIIHRVRAGQSI